MWRYFRIEIKPSVSGLRWDIETLSGDAKLSQDPRILIYQQRPSASVLKFLNPNSTGFNVLNASQELPYWGAIFTKPSNRNIAATQIYCKIGCMEPNNRFAWSQSCECFVNTASHTMHFNKNTVSMNPVSRKFLSVSALKQIQMK
jgi:hypothetical protein